jgi:hypothetical protein
MKKTTTCKQARSSPIPKKRKENGEPSRSSSSFFILYSQAPRSLDIRHLKKNVSSFPNLVHIFDFISKTLTAPVNIRKKKIKNVYKVYFRQIEQNQQRSLAL